MITNKDMTDGCEKTARKTTASDTSMQTVFLAMADTSHIYIKEFNKKIYKLGSILATDFTITGKIYKKWMKVKKLFIGLNGTSILDSCTIDHNPAQKIYNDYMQKNSGMNVEVNQLIMAQSMDLKKSFDTLKEFRHQQVN